QRRARGDVRMVGGPVVADEEALVEVRPRRLVDGRMPLHALVHRHVADVVLVDLQRALLLERRRVELARGREGAVDHGLRHAMTGQIEEADGLARAPDLERHGVHRSRRPAGRGPDVDQGDRLRRRLDVLDRQRLEDVHLWSGPPCPRRNRNASAGPRPAAFDCLTARAPVSTLVIGMTTTSRREFLKAAAGLSALAVGASSADAAQAQPLRPTPSCPGSASPTERQTEGPYFKPDSPLRASLLEPGVSGTKIVVTGMVLSTT